MPFKTVASKQSWPCALRPRALRFWSPDPQRNSPWRAGTWKSSRVTVWGTLARLPGPPSRIFADPPYNAGIDYGATPTKANRLPRAAFALIESCASACPSALPPDGSLWWLVNHEWIAQSFLALEAARAALAGRGARASG